ncbi:MAG TPA: alpha/beta hydrolase [Mycobacteriales bacterium]|nr:alpha/beta hydrolase [Mycobacteriales bacterium]
MPTEPAVVLLHGQPATSATFAPIRRRLAELRVLAPDRPGYGHNPAHGTDFPGNVDWLIKLMDAKRVDRAVLAGHSWGAGIAVLAAARHPGRVAGLVLAAPIGPHCVLPLDRLLAARVLGEGLTYGTVRLAGALLHHRRLRDLETYLDPADLPAARAALDAQLRRPVWRTFLTEQRALVRQLPLLDGALAQVAAAVRIVAGTEDAIIPRRTIEALAAELADSTVTWVDSAQHELTLHAPDAVAGAIRELAG